MGMNTCFECTHVLYFTPPWRLSRNTVPSPRDLPNPCSLATHASPHLSPHLRPAPLAVSVPATRYLCIHPWQMAAAKRVDVIKVPPPHQHRHSVPCRRRSLQGPRRGAEFFSTLSFVPFPSLSCVAFFHRPLFPLHSWIPTYCVHPTNTANIDVRRFLSRPIYPPNDGRRTPTDDTRRLLTPPKCSLPISRSRETNTSWLPSVADKTAPGRDFPLVPTRAARHRRRLDSDHVLWPSRQGKRRLGPLPRH